MKVLVVDNDRASLKETVFYIKACDRNLDIYACDDPLKALEEAEKTEFAVAFLEINMYGIPGMVFAKKLKILNPNINIIFTTVEADFAFEALNLRASGYLLKPLSKEKVSDELKNLRY